MAIQDELPRSRLTLTYKTTVNGEPETVNLPFRMLVLGDFSLNRSVDRKSDLEERPLHSIDGKTLDSVMKDMQMSLKIAVPNRVNPDAPGVSSELDVTLPITRMKSFSPDEISKNVPKIRALLLLKQLLMEMQSNIDNRKELRKLVQDIFANPKAIEALRGELKEFEGVRLPAKSTVPVKQ